MIRVAMIISRFPPCVGGTESQAFSLARELRRLGIDVRVVTQRYRSDLPAHELMDGINVFRLGPSEWVPGNRGKSAGV